MALKRIKNILTAFFVMERLARKQTKKNITDFRTDLLSDDILEQIGAEIKRYVLNRTLAGLDYEDRPFIPYSESYAKQKGVDVNNVNLKLSGEMLDSFYVEVKRHPEFEDNEVFYIDLGYLSIHYGFRTESGVEKYFYNADNQYGKDRDFLGAKIGVPLLRSSELLGIINNVISRNR